MVRDFFLLPFALPPQVSFLSTLVPFGSLFS